MRLTGQQDIAVPRRTVYDALNDADILKKSIPGCEKLEKISDTEFTAVVRIKIGPVAATFGGKVSLSDLDPPNGYVISGEGSGGVAGFAKGGAKVRLAEKNGNTMLTYEVDAQVGGKIAQVGARLIDGVAKKLAAQFFERLVEQLQPAQPDAAAPTADAPAEKPKRGKILLLALGIIVALAAAAWLVN